MGSIDLTRSAWGSCGATEGSLGSTSSETTKTESTDDKILNLMGSLTANTVRQQRQMAPHQN